MHTLTGSTSGLAPCMELRGCISSRCAASKAAPALQEGATSGSLTPCQREKWVGGNRKQASKPATVPHGQGQSRSQSGCALCSHLPTASHGSGLLALPLAQLKGSPGCVPGFAQSLLTLQTGAASSAPALPCAQVLERCSVGVEQSSSEGSAPLRPQRFDLWQMGSTPRLFLILFPGSFVSFSADLSNAPTILRAPRCLESSQLEFAILGARNWREEEEGEGDGGEREEEKCIPVGAEERFNRISVKGKRHKKELRFIFVRMGLHVSTVSHNKTRQQSQEVICTRWGSGCVCSSSGIVLTWGRLCSDGAQCAALILDGGCCVTSPSSWHGSPIGSSSFWAVNCPP